VDRIIVFALKHRVLMVALLVCLIGAGIISFLKLNIEAYPDPVPPLVDIVTQSSGQSAQEIERYVTIPIEIQLAGIQHVSSIRTISLFGLSDIKVQFTYDFTYEQAEQKVVNALSQLGALPNGAQPSISPESPIGEIFRYRVTGPPGYSVTDLKTVQDWMLERRFKAVPGVIDVSGWGGKTKTYDVSVDLGKLQKYGLTLPQVLQILGNSNLNVGGQTVEIGTQSAVVRGIGLIHGMSDISDTMLTANNGSPVFVRDVAEVTVGHLPRLGIAGQDHDDDIVQGIVLMRRGEQSLPTIRRVEAEMDRINRENILPLGVRIEKIYDRSELIGTTTHTVIHNMVIGIALIFLVQWLFLGDLRSAIIVATTIPFALFFAIIIMVARGESANLLSVGAVDFGLVVDATVILVENVFRHLGEHPAHQFTRSAALRRARFPSALPHTYAITAHSAIEVSSSIFFAAAIIVAAFVPLFTLTGVEGHIFGPMAKTYAYAIAGGLIATFTISPALSALLLPERTAESDTIVVYALRSIYEPTLRFALAHRPLILGCTAVIVVLAAICLRSLGMEFLPHLEEGNLWIRAEMPASISLKEGNVYANRMRRVIARYPEVETVVSQHGRPDDGTDATGFFNVEFFVPLKPFNVWPRNIDKNILTQQMTEDLREHFPGIDFNFSQYIEDNVEEAASGVKGENSVKLFGNDLAVLEKTAAKIKDVMASVHGITDLGVFNSLGQPTVEITVNRKEAARYGLAPGDINAVVQAAVGGQTAGNLYESDSDRYFPIVVRLAPEYRGNLAAIRRITIGVQNSNSNGVMQIPLGDVADVKLVSGASFIYRENQERYIPIKFSVRDRDLGGAVLEAQQKVAERVQLPGGYHVAWVGEFGNLQEAIKRLEIAVPLSIFLIALLLFLHFSSLTDTLLAASVIPMTLIGGIFALRCTGTPFSISAAIGCVALFGIAAMDGIIVIASFNRLAASGLQRAEAVVQACKLQMRPVMMTCVAAGAGLFPAAISTGIGSQVQKPLALVVVGGMMLAPLLILVLLPLLIDTFSQRGIGAGRWEETEPTE
jgi:cobalt-zinc-cadmium resistance protein CzcA